MLLKHTLDIGSQRGQEPEVNERQLRPPKDTPSHF